MVADGVVRICEANSLADEGLGLRFDVRIAGGAATGFVLRWRGCVVAYLNQCAHVSMELDWAPGDFLDSGREFIMCATHGAIYDPRSGNCAGGPCLGRGGLRRIAVAERDGAIWWRPDDVITAPAQVATESSRQIPPASSPAE